MATPTRGTTATSIGDSNLEGNTATVTAPAGLVAGDLVVVLIGSPCDGNGYQVPDGTWTENAENICVGASGGGTSYIASHVCTGSEPASWVFTVNPAVDSANMEYRAFAIKYSSAGGTPIAENGAGLDDLTGPTFTSQSVTTAESGDIVLSTFSQDNTTSDGAWAGSSPGGLSILHEYWSGSTKFWSMVVFEETRAAAGAGAHTVTQNTGGDNTRASATCIVAIRGIAAVSAPSPSLNRQGYVAFPHYRGLSPEEIHDLPVRGLTDLQQVRRRWIGYREINEQAYFATVDYVAPGPITPSVGTIALAGLAPTVKLVATAGVGAISLAGQVPTPKVRATPGLKNLSLAGLSASTRHSATPALKNINLAGLAPTTKRAASPNTGTISLAGLAPATRHRASPALKNISLAGLSPTIRVRATPNAANLSLVGRAPTIDSQIGVANINLAGLPPTTKIRFTNINVGNISLAGRAPTFVFRARPPAGALTLAGLVPLIRLRPTPGRGNTTLAGRVPTLKQGVTPGRGQINLAGLVPAVRIRAVPTAGGITLAGLELQGGMVVTNTANISLLGRVPTIRFRSPPPTASILLAGYTSMMYHRTNPMTANMALAGMNAVVSGGGGIPGPGVIRGTLITLAGVGH